MVLFTGLCYNRMHKWDTLPSTLYTLDYRESNIRCVFCRKIYYTVPGVYMYTYDIINLLMILSL